MQTEVLLRKEKLERVPHYAPHLKQPNVSVSPVNATSAVTILLSVHAPHSPSMQKGRNKYTVIKSVSRKAALTAPERKLSK